MSVFQIRIQAAELIGSSTEVSFPAPQSDTRILPLSPFLALALATLRWGLAREQGGEQAGGGVTFCLFGVDSREVQHRSSGSPAEVLIRFK